MFHPLHPALVMKIVKHPIYSTIFNFLMTLYYNSLLSTDSHDFVFIKINE